MHVGPSLTTRVLMCLLSLCMALPGHAPAAAPVSSELQAALPDAVVVPHGTALMAPVQRRHGGCFNGKGLRYRSVVGEVPIHDVDGEVIGSVVSIGYLGEDAGDARPVIFGCNGRPGSAWTWLPRGWLGPRRPASGTDAGGEASSPRTVAPFGLVDNHDSPLDVAEVLLIGPPGTGYSRVFGAGNAEKVFGVQQD